MLGYKVVRAYRDGWGPVVSKVYIRYVVGVKVVRPRCCGPFAVFKYVEDARVFACHMGGCVFSCEYEPASTRRLYYYVERTKFSKTGVPYGTDFAESVVLLERIQDYQVGKWEV